MASDILLDNNFLAFSITALSGVTVSGMPPLSVVITGSPIAIASMQVSPNGSFHAEGSTATSARARCAGMSW